jgi:hypothetical protein
LICSFLWNRNFEIWPLELNSKGYLNTAYVLGFVAAPFFSVISFLDGGYQPANSRSTTESDGTEQNIAKLGAPNVRNSFIKGLFEFYNFWTELLHFMWTVLINRLFDVFFILCLTGPLVASAWITADRVANKGFYREAIKHVTLEKGLADNCLKPTLLWVGERNIVVRCSGGGEIAIPVEKIDGITFGSATTTSTTSTASASSEITPAVQPATIQHATPGSK